MAGLRRSVILIMLIALAGGIWTRHFYTNTRKAESLVEIRPSFENSGLRVTGTFDEPVGDLTGFEISFPYCSRPLAILPVPSWLMAIISTEYHYRPGEYDISYVYNGNVYPETWISYKLIFLNYFYRFQSLFGLVEARQFAYCLKIWIPPDCRGISTTEASALERGLVGPIGHNNV
ncbi:MAG: hypothetical protein ACREO5_05315 [Candidatus Binatia bacterium]